MSTHAGEQAKLDAWTATSTDHDPDDPAGDDARETPSSARDNHASQLAAIFEQVTGDAVFVEPQEETPSHAVLTSEDEAPDLREDGLDDAADSDLVIGGWI